MPTINSGRGRDQEQNEAATELLLESRADRSSQDKRLRQMALVINNLPAYAGDLKRCRFDPWASLAQRFPTSSVLARAGAGCGSVGDVPGAWPLTVSGQILTVEDPPVILDQTNPTPAG